MPKKKQTNTSKFPKDDELISPKVTASEKKTLKKTKKVEPEGEPVFDQPSDLTSFERPETIKLNEIGETIEGLYEGLQPVSFNTGSVGAIVLLRQRDGKLLGINAGFDIRRFLLETGFGDLLGEYLKITLAAFVNTGMPAMMKKYAFQYRKNLQLSGANMTAKQLQASRLLLSDGEKVVDEARKNRHIEKWEGD